MIPLHISIALKIVKDELNAFCTRMDIAPGIIEIVHCDDPQEEWCGVRVRTDGDLYELFYDSMGPGALDLQQRIADKVSAAIGVVVGSQYFEAYGGGAIDLY